MIQVLYFRKPNTYPINDEQTFNQFIKDKLINETNYWWDSSDVKSNKHCLFVFGDNDLRLGKKGQAIIRDEPNAIGIPTKKKPTLKDTDFYTDNEIEYSTNQIKIAIIKIKEAINHNNYHNVIFPLNGLGTGLSQLPTRAPLTFKVLESLISELKDWISNQQLKSEYISPNWI